MTEDINMTGVERLMISMKMRCGRRWLPQSQKGNTKHLKYGFSVKQQEFIDQQFAARQNKEPVLSSTALKLGDKRKTLTEAR
jgi:hypothetical protein